ncbi:MAG: CHAT domain-containing protein [candidate division KSB1 bacterium]|nr:CHAT domain-containing protein [candidate division KSB1 bacterium]MDZ7275223.1 CHAT domain-containing protein [candidate division KSB1 bacterium]MDZ7287392.1 CHAT domain-containing protein [candidate division KSB1 bacterium]MDZ7299506.1 CHAT domain-containing protein [candidate division KSB1 bacterium]MDZ7305448.1 CHAT domain-containing protein [candidate division KSB1 bacterium]
MLGALLPVAAFALDSEAEQGIPAEYLQIRLAMGKRQYRQVQSLILECLSQPPIFPRVFPTAAYLFIYEGRPQAGLAFLTTLLADSAVKEYRGEIAGALAVLHHFLRDTAQTRVQARKALELGCRNLQPYELFIDNSDRSQALEFLQRQQQLQPANWRLQYARAYLLQSQNQAADAAALFLALLEQGHDSWEVCMTAGNNLNYQSRFQEAARLLERKIAVCRKTNDPEGLAQLLHVLSQTEMGRGNLAEAQRLRSESLALARLIGNVKLEYLLRLSLSQELLNQCRWAEAEKYLRFVQEQAQFFADGNSLLTAIYYQGRLERARGHWQASARNFLRASAIADSLGRREYAIQLLYSIALTDLKAGRVQQALARFQENERRMQQFGSLLHRRYFLHHFSKAYEQLGRHREALAYCDSALALTQAGENRRLYLTIVLDRGRLLSMLGRHTQALPVVREVAAAARQAGFVDLEVEAKIALGEIYLRAGELQPAQHLLTSALTRLQQAPDYLSFLKASAGLAETLARAGDLTRALAIYRAALQVVISNVRTASLEQSASLAGEERAIFFGLSRMLWRTGQTAEAICLAERSRDLVVQRRRWQAHLLQGSDSLQSLHARLAQLDSLILRQRLKQASQEPGFEALLLAAELQRQELIKSLPGSAGEPSVVFDQAALNNLRQMLARRQEVALSFFVDDSLSLVFLVAGDTLQGWEIAAGRQQLEPLLARMHPMLALHHADRLAREVAGFDTTTAYTAYRLLVAAPLSMRQERNLAVVPDGVLHALPFEILVTEPAAGGRAAFLLERHPIRYGLSLQSLQPPAPQPLVIKSFLLVADPLRYSESPAALSSGMRRRREDLPGSRDELEAIRANTRVDHLLTGSNATRANVLAALPQCDWLHIASHALSEAGEPLHAEILLANNADSSLDRIYAFEIFEQTLAARIAILSGCETARGIFLNGEGFAGFVQAFRAAGTPSVIASLWTVRDQATARFFASYYAALRRGQSTVRALQTAKLEMLHDSHASLLNWAGFCYYGADWQVALPPPRSFNVWYAAAIVLIILASALWARLRPRRRASGARH